MPNQTPQYETAFSQLPEQAINSPQAQVGRFGQTPGAPQTFTYTAPPQPAGVTLFGAGITVGYLRDRGLRASPAAAAYGAKAAVWRVHGGLVWKIVTAVFQAIGGPPTLPSPATNDNEVLMFDAVVIPSNEVLMDGTVVVVRAVQYFYVLQQPPADTDVLYGAVVQLDTTALSANVVNPASYVPNLLGPIPNPAQFSGGPIAF